MYERRDDNPRHLAGFIVPARDHGRGPHAVVQARERVAAEFEAFGFYADRVSTPGIKPNGITAPMALAAGGKRVITRFAITSGPGAGADASECLITLKPERPGPQHAAFLIAALADEMTEFAGRRQLIRSADIVRSIATVQGIAHSLCVDGEEVAGWALFAKGATGTVVEHRDRVLMWLGTEGATVPDAIYTRGRDGGAR